jgi:sugar phosphate isomerase/epimerase
MTSSLTRRQFLASSAALAATARLSAADADPFGGFIFGIQSYTFRSFNLEQALKRTREAGLKYGEFYRNHIPTDSSPDKLKSILALCAEYDVKPVSFGVEKFTKDHDKNKQLFDFAQAIGIKYMSADPDPDSFDSLDKLCEQTKIAIAIHPHGPSGKGLHRWYNPTKILEAVKDHNPLIGTCLDTGHLIRTAQVGEKLDPVEQIKIMGARNFGLHLKDHDNKRKTDVVFGSPDGVLDVLGVLKALREVNFKGYIAIEYEANPSDPSADVQKCVQYVKDAVKKLG